MALAVGLSAVICASDATTPYILATKQKSKSVTQYGLPFGQFDPHTHQKFELALRDWVLEQTGHDLQYVEQLYTFGDKGRDIPQAQMPDAAEETRIVSIGYLGLTSDKHDVTGFEADWQSWYRYFPWEDHREGRPEIIEGQIQTALYQWAEEGETSDDIHARIDRARLAFGLEAHNWVEERVLERYELLYEAGLAEEAQRLESGDYLPVKIYGLPMMSDHRRILATAMSRLRGKLKYRPVIFELLGESFTLSDLQQNIEAILGLPLHKQNFRRGVEKRNILVATGDVEAETGGRPAALFRFKREEMQARLLPGLSTPKA